MAQPTGFLYEQVENNDEVRPALTRPDIGHITALHLICLGHGGTAVQGS